MKRPSRRAPQVVHKPRRKRAMADAPPPAAPEGRRVPIEIADDGTIIEKPVPEVRPRSRTNRPARGVTPPDQHVRVYKPGTTHVSPNGSKHVDR